MTTHRASTGPHRAIAVLCALAFVPLFLAAGKPPVVGDWNGALDAGSQGKLRLIVHVTQAKDGSLTGTVDSPDQSVSGIVISSATYNEPAFHFECSQIGGVYEGKMNKDNSEIDGTWSQSGNSLVLNLTRSK